MYKKVSTSLNFVDNELATEKFWKENEIFKKSVEMRKETRGSMTIFLALSTILFLTFCFVKD